MEFRNYSRSRLFHVGVEDTFLLEIVRHGVLGQKRRLEPDFGANPFTFAMWCAGRMVAASAAAELRAEIGALDLIELADLLPSGVAHRVGHVDFEVQHAHDFFFHHRGAAMAIILSEAVVQAERRISRRTVSAPREIPRRGGENARLRDDAFPASLRSTVREPLVQHEIDNHARNRYIHPKRPGPARDGAVLGIAALESAGQRNDCQRHDDNR